MAVTLFSDLYDFIRVATGNEDPVVGAETLPNERIDVLLKTAVLTLPNYSESFPTLNFDKDASGNLFAYSVSSPDAALDVNVIIGLVHAVAHKYFTGIGNSRNASDALSAIFKASESYSGYAIETVNESDLDAATIYKQRKQKEATSQSNLR